MEINNVCSFGTFCHTSYLLKRNGWKRNSYPFDWIFSSKSMIIDCLEDGFKKFLDKSLYTSISETNCGHNLYGNSMFMHHNPLNNEKDYEYFVRCVNRLNILLTSPEHKLLLSMIYVNISYNIDTIKNEIIEFNNKLKNYVKNYTLLFILNISERENAHIFTYYDNIHLLELHTVSETNGLEFKNKDDNIYLDNILKAKYKFIIE
jgi:hypothetical protein